MVETHVLFYSTLSLSGDCGLNRLLGSNDYGEKTNLGS